MSESAQDTVQQNPEHGGADDGEGSHPHAWWKWADHDGDTLRLVHVADRDSVLVAVRAGHAAGAMASTLTREAAEHLHAWLGERLGKNQDTEEHASDVGARSRQVSFTDKDDDTLRVVDWRDGSQDAALTVSIARGTLPTRAVHLTREEAHRLGAFLLADLPVQEGVTESLLCDHQPAPGLCPPDPVWSDGTPYPGGEVLPHGEGDVDPLRLIVTGGHGPALVYITDQGVPVRLDRDQGEVLPPGANVHTYLGLAPRDWVIVRGLVDHALNLVRRP